MGTTRINNIYKNPSYAYNKDLSISSIIGNLRAYNVATGNLPPPPSPPPPPPPNDDLHSTGQKKSSKRRRRCQKLDDMSVDEENDIDGPLSHQDYIHKRRQDIDRDSSRVYQELTPEDVLSNPSSTFQPLVQYESDDDDESNSTGDPDQGQDLSNDDYGNEPDRVKKRAEQRFPIIGEPACVVCGKYGEYICDETGDDICSTDCKADLLLKAQSAEGAINCHDSRCLPGTSMVKLPEVKEDAWDFGRNRWTTKRSSLCTYECWNCQKPGHLPEDCLMITRALSSPSTSSHVPVGARNSSSISKDLLALYRICHQIGKNLHTAKCSICRSSSSLGMCLDCSISLCDDSGHLNEHIISHPSHQKIYSFKLQRLVKCCKSTCGVTDIKDLLACHYCLDKAFEKFYDMYSASWKRAGLSIIWNSICCEEHFTWHRINCTNADVDGSACIVKKHTLKNKCSQLSDFIF
ncbi:hypothetical protein C5167_027040 [Papaver somniferum]|uniref:uncharacterized protein LOC113335902 n=1 Tax=Papaver somniferum TaxID=3469 RepID=UPI000E70585C|nr:uncharacterized protein LOC113335902 [Papaver somniferum]RZC89497.1 hypothetical protein C5167_027040 [Papaver somniferum]